MITQSDVRYVARLARLHLDDDEAQRMTGELARILEHVAKIGELDLSSVPPMAHVLDVVNVDRTDKPRPGLTREDALRNAPAVADEGFRVPRMSGR
jgi:aspartyl-tRNA(Asn)/glutamyl-tRNA(Gln) amidotransferase subunit C